MSASNFNSVFGYSLAMVTALAAVTILTGILLPAAVPLQLRVMFGIVLLLLSVYRFTITFINRKHSRRIGDE